VEKIRFVCATRGSSEEFFSSSLLGRSLLNFRSFPIGQPIEVKLFQNNTTGLPAVYNTAIDESRSDPGILIFCHDDLMLCDYFWVDRLLQAFREFQIVGLCGNRRRLPRQPSWRYLDERFTSDTFENFSGVVGHGEGLPKLTQLSIYGPPGVEVKLLDGMLLAVRSESLLSTELRFDPQFGFHFYDLDFCRQAELRGLKMGTCAMSVVHGSAGRLGTPVWAAAYQTYLRKYGE
jgi:GT2 family glycosyltransferase